MSLTNAQLDRLCGGAPTAYRECPYPRCDRVVGPYYVPALVREALREHLRWVHSSEAPVVRDEAAA